MPKVSIIVPVYKVEKYIHRCAESILAQTFTDFELILVDDGSPDNSGIICDEYAQKDHRVTVIHQENCGVSAARNAGLLLATGDFVSFCDADDELAENALEVLLAEMEKSHSQMVVGGFKHVKVNSSQNSVQTETSLHRTYGHISLDDPEQMIAFWKDNNMLSACAKLYLGDVIRSNMLSFRTNLIVLEDYAFVIDYLSCIHAISMIPDVVYIRNSSADSPLEKRRSRIDFYDDVLFVAHMLEVYLREYPQHQRERMLEISIFPTLKLAYSFLWSTSGPTVGSRVKKYRRIKCAMGQEMFRKMAQFYKREYTMLEYICMTHNILWGILVIRVIRRFF